MRRIGLAGALAMLLTLVGLTFAAPGAMAAGTVGSFEIDGNLIDSPAGEPIDWSTPVSCSEQHRRSIAATSSST